MAGGAVAGRHVARDVQHLAPLVAQGAAQLQGALADGAGPLVHQLPEEMRGVVCAQLCPAARGNPSGLAQDRQMPPYHPTDRQTDRTPHPRQPHRPPRTSPDCDPPAQGGHDPPRRHAAPQAPRPAPSGALVLAAHQPRRRSRPQAWTPCRGWALAREATGPPPLPSPCSGPRVRGRHSPVGGDAGSSTDL